MHIYANNIRVVHIYTNNIRVVYIYTNNICVVHIYTNNICVVHIYTNNIRVVYIDSNIALYKITTCLLSSPPELPSPINIVINDNKINLAARDESEQAS